MDWIRKKLAVFESKSARKLVIISAVLTLVISLIAVTGTFLTSMINEISLLQGHVCSIPPLVEERSNELRLVYQSYRNDYIARGDIATTLYDKYDNLDLQARLEFARRHADALNVTLLDANGNFIASATGKKPSRAVTAAYAAIDEDPEPLFDATMSDINAEAFEDEDGFVPETDSMPMVYDGHASDGNLVMVEMDYTAFGQVISERSTWNDIFGRVMNGMDGYGFFIDKDGEIGGYPLDDLSDDQGEQLVSEVKAAFTSLKEELPPAKSSDKSTESSGNKKFELTTSFDFVSLLGKQHLVVMTTPDEDGNTFMIAVPLTSFAGFTFLCDLAIIALVVVGYVLFSRFATQSFREDPIEADDDKARFRTALKRSFGGIAVMLVVTGLLSAMLLMLEGLSNTARSTISQFEAINSEAKYTVQRKSAYEEEYTAHYRSRATSIARLLTDHPEMRTLDNLKELNKIAQSSHLMLFDKDGKEIFDSSGFTGFDVYDEKTGGRPEWQPVLQGYIQVETPSAVNPVTGQHERTIATHITDEQGLPDGFLLMVVNDDDLEAEIGDASLEGVVNGFTPLAGQMAAVVDNETGLFLAHTDPDMVGEDATNYLSPDVIGRNFDGFTSYEGNISDVYVSGVSTDGKTTLVITDSAGNEVTKIISWVMIGIILLLIFLVFYPTAASLTAKYVLERPTEDELDESGHPMMVFYRGYVAYLAALAVVSFLGVIFGFWKAFEAVYIGGWTPGIHLFSFWMVLFIFAVLSYIMIGLHKIIRHIDEQSSTRTKTYARLTDSLVTYVMSILMIILILSRLGVDTATIIGSISIISIAVGMGAQDLVKDIVAGLFLIFEGTIAVGDLVEIAGFRGYVTDMGIRTTKVSWYGETKVLNNSDVRNVLNSNGDPTRMVLPTAVTYEADLEEIEAILAEELPLMEDKIPGLVKAPQYEGIDSLGESSVNLCIAIYVDYVKRNSALRLLAREIKIMFDRRGIEMPYNQLVLYNGDLAAGNVSDQAPSQNEVSADEEKAPEADNQ